MTQRTSGKAQRGTAATDRNRMFGTFRTVLAVFVVVGHLHGPAHLGVFAVFGFYVLSGLLMTKVMAESYTYGRSGASRFLLNRALRIYPAYWFTAGLTLLVLWFTPTILRDFHPDLVTPSSIEGWVRNLTLVLSPYSGPRLSPATWALTVELFYYVLIGLGLTKTVRRSWVFLGIGIVATIWLAATGDDWGSRYYPIPAAALPFAVGALLHHRGAAVRRALGRVRFADPRVALGFLAVNFAAFGITDRVLDNEDYTLSLTIGFYLNLAFMLVAVATLADARPGRIDRRTDATIGDYSYPIYLTHWLGAAVADLLVVDSMRDVALVETDGWLYTGLGLLVSVALSVVIIRIVDPSVAGLRDRVRPLPQGVPDEPKVDTPV